MSLNNLPEVNFVEINAESILNEIIANYENAYLESTGDKITLAPGDPIRIFLYSQALREIQLLNIINETGKQNLLKYSKGNALENIGAPSRTVRNLAKKARTRQKLTFSAPQNSVFTLPVGWRVGTANNVIFSTIQAFSLPIGQTELIVEVECELAGELGNGYLPGQVNVIIDPQPYLISAVNLDETQGGAEIESDDSLRERIYQAPEKRAVAGPEELYVTLAKEYNQSIDVVKATSLAPGQVDLFILLKNGELPTQTFLEGLLKYLSPKNKRPLTDKVSCNSPIVKTYDIDFTYYIRASDIAKELEIKNSVEASVASFNKWQMAEIGRDINPSKLTSLIIEAGAKRADIRTPIFTPISSDVEVANVAQINIVYGGVEND